MQYELPVDGLVAHYRDRPVHDGQDRVLSDDLTVSFVLGVDGHTGVAQHGLRPGGGDGDERLGVVFQGIADVVELAVNVLVVNFQVAEAG